MDPATPNYLFVMLSTAAIYLFLIVAIVLFGKNELTQLSITDLVFILLISNAVQNAMVNANPTDLYRGLLAACTLFILNFALKRIMYRSKGLTKFIEGQPVMLIYHGKIMEENMKSERITMNELEAAVREHGIANISDVDLAMFESDGNISVIGISDEKKIPFKRRSRKIPARIKRQDS